MNYDPLLFAFGIPILICFAGAALLLLLRWYKNCMVRLYLNYARRRRRRRNNIINGDGMLLEEDEAFVHALLFRLIAEAQARRYAIRRQADAELHESSSSNNSNTTCLLLHTKAYKCSIINDDDNNVDVATTRSSFSHENNNNDSTGTMCSICLAEFESGDIVATSSAIAPASPPAVTEVTTCPHIFHEECIKDWLKRNNSCPLCKLQFADEVQHVRRNRTMNHHRRDRSNAANEDDEEDEEASLSLHSSSSSLTSLNQQQQQSQSQNGEAAQTQQLEFERELRELTLSLGNNDANANVNVTENISTWMRLLMGPILFANSADDPWGGAGEAHNNGRRRETTFQNVRIDLQEQEQDQHVVVGCGSSDTSSCNHDEHPVFRQNGNDGDDVV
mmetsp:Transcript_2978/g.4274  ORF Transcript_2978/g.4274 Transcript_2978/m.4274 type:complete len:390 (-) Transcript_2978:99-1268(-)|eukprot:CAMPEP_0116015156 /NCGR_PEP_ID=MMETSP0321-20121206/6674_1 /TAXON_ID=163516 /ORGANISM="Leptocylindrus danicus var. danicus, Strain B650" /LENGTH=389 /DNA_ID=CAMNT_0003484883 /DNA_START=87 /DNA_END=1256 /DNA_ORIENTATION=+